MQNWTEPAEKASWAGPAETKESWAGPAEMKESCAGPAETKESSKVGQSGGKHRDNK